MAEQKEQCSSFRVIYYPFTGRAEPLRLAAAIGGIAFEDEFITQDQQKKAKAEGKRRWSGPPEVVIYDKDGKELTVIAQSNTCTRYIGNKIYLIFLYKHHTKLRNNQNTKKHKYRSIGRFISK